MGQRYQAILKHLREPFDICDMGTGVPKYEKYDRFILATPTETHFRFVQILDKFRKPILCEKPLATNRHEIAGILDCKSPLSMMVQYAYYDREFFHGESSYNYFRHGKDGLVWDCFQIIALARGIVTVKEDSPIWCCYLNGEDLDLNKMDSAYVWATRNFLNNIFISKEQMLDWHVKVLEYEDKWRKLSVS